MKALILAAGLGTRLRPWTLNHPKALYPINGIPLLRRVIDHIGETTGIDSFIVTACHFSNQIKDYVEHYLKDVDVSISDETDNILDTGGGILKASAMQGAEEELLVHNVDILTDFNLSRLIDSHKSNGNDATLLVQSRDTSRYLLFDEDSRLKGWLNRKTGETLPESLDFRILSQKAFGGIHIINSKVLLLLKNYATEKKVEKFPVVPFYVEKAHDMIIRGFESFDGYKWVDTGKPDSVDIANKLFH